MFWNTFGRGGPVLTGLEHEKFWSPPKISSFLRLLPSECGRPPSCEPGALCVHPSSKGIERENLEGLASVQCLIVRPMRAGREHVWFFSWLHPQSSAQSWQRQCSAAIRQMNSYVHD